MVRASRSLRAGTPALPALTILLRRVSIFRAVSSFHLPFVPAAWIAAGLVASAAVEAAPAAYVPVAFSVAPAVLAEPVAPDALLAEPRAALTARGLVAAEPAAVPAVCVVEAPAASAPAAVANDAPALAVFDFAGAVARQHVVAADSELSVVWQLLFALAAADASSAARPGDELVGPSVGPQP